MLLCVELIHKNRFPSHNVCEAKGGNALNSIYYTDHLILRILDPSFAPSVLNFYQLNRAHFEPWEPLRPPNFYTTSYHRCLLTAEHNLLREREAIRYFLFEKENTHKIIGSVNFYHIEKNPENTCKLGYKLSTLVAHKGYATEAVSFLIPHIFQEFNLHRIEADIMERNLPSIRLIEKLNFTLEGITREGFEVCGTREDHLRYALLRSELPVTLYR